jgi:hypothetical protein
MCGTPRGRRLRTQLHTRRAARKKDNIYILVNQPPQEEDDAYDY